MATVTFKLEIARVIRVKLAIEKLITKTLELSRDVKAKLEL